MKKEAGKINSVEEFYSILEEKYALGNAKLVEEFLLQELNMHKPCCGNYDSMQITVQNELGNLYRELKRYKEAVGCYSAAGHVAVIHLGEQCLEYADILANIAGIHYETGELKQAVIQYEHAIEIYKRSGKKNLYTFSAVLNNCAAIYYKLGMYEKAEQYFRDLLEYTKDMKNIEQEIKIAKANLNIICRKKCEEK